jgi:hypothetical protein
MSGDASGFFRDGVVTHEGRTYALSAAEVAASQGPGPYQHSPGDPSTWLCVSVFTTVRARFPALPTETLLDLTGQTLRTDAAKLRGAIEWNENYMRWHDGDDGYRVL